MSAQFAIPGGAATVLAVAAVTSTTDPFDKSPQNPVNMSRTANHASHNNAPSGKLLDRVRVAATDIAQLATIQAGWRYVTDKNNTSVYEMNGAVLPPTVSVASTFGNRAGSKPSDYYVVKGVTSVRADVDRVLTMLDTTTTEAFSLRMNQIFGRYYQQGVVIDHMSATSPPAQVQNEDGFCAYSENDAYAVNWMSLKPLGSAENARDFTFASYQDTFMRDPRGALIRLGRRAARDPAFASTPNAFAMSSASVSSTASRRPESRLLGVHALSSFNFKDIPELPRHKHTDRMHIRTSGIVVEDTHEPGVVRLSLFLSLTPVAATLRSPKKFEKWLQAMALCVGNLALQLQKPTSNNSPETRTIQWKRSDHCALCLKSFHTFRRCHHCRFCGEAVCNKCSGFVDSSKVQLVRAAMPAAGDHYSEMRGCTRCIHSLMNDVANVHSTPIVRTSTTGSHSSGRHSRLGGSFLSDQQQQPSPLVVHHYDDDDLSSMDSSDSHKYGLPRPPFDNNSPVPMVQNARQQSDEALTLDELEGYVWSRTGKTASHPKTTAATLEELEGNNWSRPAKAAPPTHKTATLTMEELDWSAPVKAAKPKPTPAPAPMAMPHLAKPPRDTHRSNSVSTASTSHSIHSFSDDPNLRTSVASHENSNAPPRLPVPTKSDPALDLHDNNDDEFEDDKMGALASSPPRPTTSSTSSSSRSTGSFKFSLMSSHLSLLSDADGEPTSESFSGHAYAGMDHRPLPPTASLSPTKLFSASAGPRLHSQQFQSRPPRPQPHALPPVDRSRASSSASSALSLRAPEEMSIVPPPATVSSKNDMILLAPPAPSSPTFVEFSDSRRESICVRPGDGSDMIPLHF